MHKIFFAFLGAIFALSLLTSAPARAEDKPVVDKIAVVDVQALMGESKAGKSIQAQLNKQRESFQGEFSKLEKDLGETEKKLAAEKAKMNAADFESKRKDFEAKVVDARKQVQARRQALEKGTSDVLMDLRKAIVKIVADMSQKEGYTLVIARQDVVIARNDMDITDKVMAQLDKDVPDMKLKVESAAAAAPAADAKK